MMTMKKVVLWWLVALVATVSAGPKVDVESIPEPTLDPNCEGSVPCHGIPHNSKAEHLEALAIVAEATAMDVGGSVEVSVEARGVGSLVQVRELKLDSAVSGTIHTCGDSNEVLFVYTSSGHLWRSINNGLLWEDETDQGRIPDGAYGVYGIKQSPANLNTLFIVGRTKTHWVTKDCGETYIHLPDTDVNISGIQLHPSESEWVLASHHVVDLASGNFYSELFFSLDLGATFTKLQTHVYQYSWDQDLLLGKDSSAHVKRIMMTHFPDKSKDQPSYLSPEVEFVYSDDFFTAPSFPLFTGATGFLSTDKRLYLSAYADGDILDMELYVRTDVEEMHFTNTLFPNADLTRDSFTILHPPHSTATTFIFVEHTSSSSWGHLYASDSTGAIFTMSLSHMVGYLAASDLEVVDSLPGFMIANRYLPAADGFISNTVPIVTVVTDDAGGEWRLIPSSNVYGVDGAPLGCLSGAGEALEGCSLHLNGPATPVGASRASGFWSPDDAVGLVMATGGLGLDLESVASHDSFISRDGGITWRMLREGLHRFGSADHGGVIVALDGDEKSASVYFTWTEGTGDDPWDTIDLTARSDVEPFQAYRVSHVGEETDPKFVVRGTIGWFEPVLLHLDFEPIHEEECKEPQHPGTTGSDYETWAPAGFDGSQCYMGMTSTYVRRKMDAACHNSEEYEALLSTERCECKQSDYECDIGYLPAGDGMSAGCQAAYDVDVSVVVPDPCPAGTTYLGPITGYRKVPGNNCNGGVDLTRHVIECPADPNVVDGGGSLDPPEKTSSAAKIVGAIFVVILCICVVAALLAMVFRSHPWVRSHMPWVEHLIPRSRAARGYGRLEDDEMGIMDDDTPSGISVPAEGEIAAPAADTPQDGAVVSDDQL